jgi:uncharacterized protein
VRVETEADDEIEWSLFNAWDHSFDWDEHNLKKLAKHDVTQDEVESILESEVLFGGRIIPPEHTVWREKRYIFLGKATSKKRLALIWTKRGSSMRPITCRRMRDDEKKKYDQITK